MRNKFWRILQGIILATFISALMLLAVSAANIVYIKDGGTGDGSSPDNAVGTLTKAHNALDLSKDDATIVVCGPYTQSVNWVYSKEFEGTVTFTSVYDGVDYRETADASYNIGKYRFMCLGNNKFENLTFNCTDAYCLFVAQHYDITFGRGISIRGDQLLGTAIANSFSIVGGYQNDASLAVSESSKNTNITVLSGSKYYVVPFSRGIENGKFTGTANVTIGGTANVSVLHGSVAHSDGVEIGNVKVTLQDSAVIGNFYGCTDDITAKSYTFNYKGGTVENFYWVCPATEGKVLTVTGKKTLNISGDVDYYHLIDEFDTISGGRVAFLKDGGTGDGSTLNAAAGNIKTAFSKLDLTKDCTVVICGPFTQTADFSYGKAFTGSVTFTSVWDGVDYRETEGANWQFDSVRMACYGETKFENLDFVSTGAYYRVVGQHNPVTIGDGVTVSGDGLVGSTMSNSFVVMGGYEKGFGKSAALDKNAINISINSGSKLYVLAYSYNMQGVYKGEANITLGGTADVSVLHATCAYPSDVTLGDVKIKITDDAIVRRMYGCTQDTTVNSIEVVWQSGKFYNLKWTTASSINLNMKNPAILRISESAAATMYYEDIAKNFDFVVNSFDVESDITIASPDETESALIGKYAGPLDYKAFVLGGSDDAQIFVGIPGDVNGNLYKLDGENVVKLDSDNVGNGLIGFDLEEEGTYICSADEFIVCGDANFDKFLTVADTLLILKYMLGDAGIPMIGVDVDDNQTVNLLDVLRQLRMVVGTDKPEEEFTFDPDDYNVISVADYQDKTKLGFLSQLVGFLSGYEFARDPVTHLPMIAMPDSYFEMCNGAYADPKEFNLHGDKLLLNEETGLLEVWNDDDFSIDILDQYILRDSYARYGTFNTKVITDDWIAYDVYDMGGGNRDIGAYGLMKNYQYLSVFAGNTEMCNNFNVNGEPYIGNETLGMNAPGMPDLAVNLAHKFGSATSDRDPLEWLKMFAAMYSMAYFEDDVPTIIRTAQQATMVEGSWPYDVVDGCFEIYEKHPDNWRDGIIEAEKVFRSMNYDNASYMGCTSINCSFIILGLLYGDGDFYETCKIISLAGHGGDSTTPTALGVVGIITGWNGLDSISKSIINEKVWQDGQGVIVNRPLDPDGSYGTWMHMAGLDERFLIQDLLDMYQQNFENVLYDNGGFKLDGNYYIPKQTISSVETAYAEHFEDGSFSDYTVKGGTVVNSDAPFMGAYAPALTASESGDSMAYTTVSGLTVGETYKLSAFILTSDGVTAHMFARESGADITNYVTVHDSNVYVRRFITGEGETDMCSYVKRELVFTATKSSMEIGFMLPVGTVSDGRVEFDAVEVIRFAETEVADVTVSGRQSESGAYNGLIRFDIDGGSEDEVWLKLTYSATSGALEKAFTCVNRAWQSRTPIVPTNGGKVTIFIPVLVNNDTSNLITLFVGENNVTVHEAKLVSISDRF